MRGRLWGHVHGAHCGAAVPPPGPPRQAGSLPENQRPRQLGSGVCPTDLSQNQSLILALCVSDSKQQKQQLQRDIQMRVEGAPSQMVSVQL